MGAVSNWTTITSEMVGVSFFLVLLAVGQSQASCFGKDTGFTSATAKPTVTQPSRSDPTKVMVDYSKILKNPQCADSFTILVWADGTQQSSIRWTRISSPRSWTSSPVWATDMRWKLTKK